MEADEALLDTGTLAGRVSGVTRALELVGPKTLRDTLGCVERGGVVCSTGILGGASVLDGFDPIKDIPNGAYLTGFFSNDPTQPVLDAVFSFLRDHRLRPRVGAAFGLVRIADACRAQDGGTVNGKIVVTVP